MEICMNRKALLCVFFLAVNLVASASPDSISAARSASTEFLAMVDGLKYQESWSEASSLLQGAVIEADWAKYLDSIRSPLGKVESRNLETSEFQETLEGLPDGEYFIFVFESSYENRKYVVSELVALAKEADSSWRVVGYYFN
jgi:hypothetical protein